MGQFVQHHPARATAVLIVVLALIIAACSGPQEARGPWGAPGSAPASDQGPGMRRPGSQPLDLRVPRTYDLAHVEPANVAAALGNDHLRIFEYVRDYIGYEPYAGRLRGPRGTLLAMAGNAADRAALLASLLTHAGHTVRFARGTLAPAEARVLVMSMWALRGQPASPGSASPPAAVPPGDPFAELETAVNRDLALIRTKLTQAQVAMPASNPPVDALVQEAAAHYWVQLKTNTAWMDLDPSFGDASPGTVYTTPQETLTELPSELLHRITVRVRLEEYAEGKPAIREVLSHTVAASDLSGSDVILVHLPAAWSPGQPAQANPSSDQPVEMKPVLFIGRQTVPGQSFVQGPARDVASRVTTLLGSSGPPSVLTAEWVDVEFVSPDGRREVVVREIFDLVGPDRRQAGKSLTEAELMGAAGAVDLTVPLYSLFISTGRIDPTHLPSDGQPPALPEGTSPNDAVPFLRAIHVAVIVASDALGSAFSPAGRRAILFYPNTPRLQILELSATLDALRVALDLRRDHVRGVALDNPPEDLFYAHVLRGVVNGTLERVYFGHLFPAGSTQDASAMSTSIVFDRAQAEGVSALLLPKEAADLDSSIPPDVAARLRAAQADGFLVVVPSKPVTLGGSKRLGWWRIDPRSGETVAVTDDGLHQGTTEKPATDSTMRFWIHRGSSGWWSVTVTQHGYGFTRVVIGASRVQVFTVLARIVWNLLRNGARFGGFGTPHFTPLPR
jgi:hypothetical protein